jgi:hypothetical protein
VLDDTVRRDSIVIAELALVTAFCRLGAGIAAA